MYKKVRKIFYTFAYEKFQVMKKAKVLYVSQEMAKYLPDTEMSLKSRFLPQYIQESGKEIRCFMPRYGIVNERRNQLHEVIRLSGMNLIIDDTDHPLIIKVASLPSARIQVYFIDNDDYFQNRQFACDKTGKEYLDNDERTIFFARGVLETVKKLRWNPDIIHCHGWLSALIPLYIKTANNEETASRDSKVVYSLYDKAFDGTFHDNYPELLIAKDMKISDSGEFCSPIDYNAVMKKAIDFSDGVVRNTESVDVSLLNYAKSKSIPVLECEKDGFK